MKVYVKPELYYESFELSQNVATCDYRLGADSSDKCTITKDNCDKDGADFTGAFVSEKICEITADNFYCYTAGSGSLPHLFKS